MESLKEKIFSEKYSAESMKVKETVGGRRLWSVMIIANISECKVDGEYVVVRKECIAESEYEARRKLGVELNQK